MTLDEPWSKLFLPSALVMEVPVLLFSWDLRASG
jgi:hypothetical protein